MDYYTRKAKSQEFIRKVINNIDGEADFDLLALQVTDLFCMGEGFVRRYLEKLEKSGLIKLNGKSIIKVSE